MEQWKPVAGYEGLYEVSDHGRVRSLDRVVKHGRSGTITVKGRIMKPRLSAKGYVHSSLRRDGKNSTKKVHRLVAGSFLPPIAGKTQVNHKNCDKTDNKLSNLEWCTHAENIEHAIRKGRRSKKLNAEAVRLIRGRVASGWTQRSAAREAGVCYGLVSKIIKGERWAHI